MSDNSSLDSITKAVSLMVRAEETAYGTRRPDTDSLWDHLLRVAGLARRLARSEGLHPTAGWLAGLFHDAGKFENGRYHEDDRPEEERSADRLRALAPQHGFGPQLVEPAAEAILQLYRDDVRLCPLARVLFDADNLDKLGPLGIANYFAKVGLRGRGVSPRALHRLTVELTYARHAVGCMTTTAGRRQAEMRAPATIAFIHQLIDALREDGIYHFDVDPVEFNGLTLDIVTPSACTCGGRLERELWEDSGVKCAGVGIRHRCIACGDSQELRFCRPRLSGDQR